MKIGIDLHGVIEDWFKNYSLSSYHASRDGHRNSREFIRYEIIEVKEN